MKRLALWIGVTLLCAGPAYAGSQCDCGDGDGVIDEFDNCSDISNPGQDDTDGDDCGNVCDADYDQSGLVGVSDFGQFGANFNSSNQVFCHREPIPGCVVGVDDFGLFGAMFNTVPGPSGTTVGTTACP